MKLNVNLRDPKLRCVVNGVKMYGTNVDIVRWNDNDDDFKPLSFSANMIYVKFGYTTTNVMWKEVESQPISSWWLFIPFLFRTLHFLWNCLSSSFYCLCGAASLSNFEGIFRFEKAHYGLEVLFFVQEYEWTLMSKNSLENFWNVCNVQTCSWNFL